eukprot:12962613-Alexandrium_andersonii.AAC.1
MQAPYVARVRLTGPVSNTEGLKKHVEMPTPFQDPMADLLNCQSPVFSTAWNADNKNRGP